MAAEALPRLTDRLVLELQGEPFTLALQPAGGGFPMTAASIEELAGIWPTEGTWQLVAVHDRSGRVYPAKSAEISALLQARLTLDREGDT